jgi:hypothetical protein
MGRGRGRGKAEKGKRGKRVTEDRKGRGEKEDLGKMR